MSGELQRGDNAGHQVASRGANQHDAGQSTDVSTMEFTGVTIDFVDDMPSAFRGGTRSQTNLTLPAGTQARGGGGLVRGSASSSISITPGQSESHGKIAKSLIASNVEQLAQPRKSSGRVVQRRVGWAATPSLIVITTAERELRKSGEGKYVPSGEWLIENRRTHRDTSGRAAKRTGTVSVDRESARPASSSSEETPEATDSVTESFPAGARALGTLPATVRRSAIARVPLPRFFDGQIVQYSDGQTGQPTSFEVNILRMDAERAVVLHGSRDVEANAWQVTQATYNLENPEIEQA